VLETLETGRDAFQRHAWNEAQQAFSDAARSEPLSPEDLQLLAEAWWWSGRPDDALEAWERAYTGYVEAGQLSAAAMIAMELAYLAFRRLAFSIGGGWMARAEEAYRAIAADFPREAPYVLPLAFRKRVLFTWNLREIHHFVQLRSAPQGHVSYRGVAQAVYRELERVQPLLAKYIRVDLQEYPLGRLGS